ncbi:alpha-soluble NSF attachment protein-like isoform X1 [Bidens hawaiensis]|uniref:alpha-soluble NSF attachment protein-like isoform X1 n=1 Tax=Bidens hawaiensis TaxID=980011 RepID=UPI00404B1FC5
MICLLKCCIYLFMIVFCLQVDSKHEAANAYADAGHCYKKTNSSECISRLEQSLDLFMEIGRLGMSARYCKEIAELYEQEQNLEKAMVYFDKAADLYQGEEVNSHANQCRLKIAQYAAELEQYQKAIEIYEDIARHALNNNLLKYGVRGHLLNAGICQLCKADVVAITNALEKYEDMDPTFSGSREYKLLEALAASIDEEDVEKFTDAIKEFDSKTKLDAQKTTLLLRVKEMLKAKEMEEDDLT